MRFNNVPFMATYRGSKEFKPDENSEVIILHEFLDPFGDPFNITDNFTGEIGKSYPLNIRFGKYQKEGKTQYSYKVSLLKIADFRKSTAKKEG